MAELILGIDIGTTSLKTAVFDYTGQKISSAIMEYSLLTPELNVVEAPCDIYSSLSISHEECRWASSTGYYYHWIFCPERNHAFFGRKSTPFAQCHCMDG